MTPRPRHLLLLAHGSRDARWRRPFEALRRRLEQGAGAPVGLAYLQHSSPDLAQALAEARDQGARRVLVLPVFMSGGGHLLRDVPDTVAQAAATVPTLRVCTVGALAEEEEVVQGMVAAALRLLAEE